MVIKYEVQSIENSEGKGVSRPFIRLHQGRSMTTDEHADELCDYVEATLNTQEDNIQNVLSATMSDLPESCMREGLEGSYSYTYQTPRHQLKVKSFRHHKFDEEPGEKKDADNGEGISPR